MFSAEELHQIHDYLAENLNQEIRIHQANTQPHKVSWYYMQTHYVIEKNIQGYRAYSYHTPMDCKDLDAHSLPVFSELQSCLNELIKDLEKSNVLSQ